MFVYVSLSDRENNSELVYFELIFNVYYEEIVWLFEFWYVMCSKC